MSNKNKNIKVEDLIYTDYDKMAKDAKEIKKRNKKKKKKKFDTIYSIEAKRAQEKIEQNMSNLIAKDKKRLDDEEYERTRERTDLEKATQAVANAYEKKNSKLPIITGIILGIIIPIIVVFSVITINKNNQKAAYLYECESIVGHSRLEYISGGVTKYKDEIQKKIDNNEPIDDENIFIKIERFSNVCEKGLDIPENSIYYFYSIVGIGK